MQILREAKNLLVSDLHLYWPERVGFRRVLGVVDPEVERLLVATDDFTLVNGRRRVGLVREARGVCERGVPGDFVELGVHRGGTAGILAKTILDDPARELHLFDRWGDLPEATAEDGARAKEYSGEGLQTRKTRLQNNPPLPDVKRLLHDVLGFPAARTHYYQGWYEDTVGPNSTYSGRPIAFASVDCDWYASMNLALDFVVKYASPGAVIVADDYASWPGAGQAVREMVARLGSRAKLTVHRRIDQAVIRL